MIKEEELYERPQPQARTTFKRNETRSSFYNRSFAVVRDKHWKFSRIVDKDKRKDITSDEVIMYDKLSIKEAKAISSAFSRTRENSIKYFSKAVGGLFNLFSISLTDQGKPN